MDGIVLTQTEQQQVVDLAQRMVSLSATDLDAAHWAWKQAAHNITSYEACRRLYLEHMALETAVQAKLKQTQQWEAFAFQQAFGDLF